MNLSLKNRVSACFIVANLVVLILSFTVFHFLHSLNEEMKSITSVTSKEVLLTEEINIRVVSILKTQRRFIAGTVDARAVERLGELTDGLISLLQRLDTHYDEDQEMRAIVTGMSTYAESLKVVLGKGSFSNRDRGGIESVTELADKIFDSFSDFRERQFSQAGKRDQKITSIIEETKRNMMITLIIGFLGTIILGLVVPGKIALPFKKIKDAIRELQENNFDVSIFYNQEDEIGEIAREMNKMIQSFKKFDELRTDRISVENRKFDALASVVRRPVLVANADAKLIYMNTTLYSLLQVQSEDVIGKNIEDTILPESITKGYELAIKRRSKMENAEIVIPGKWTEEELAEFEKAEGDEPIPEPEPVYQGYANVIPIRGKDSSLDYYLMVLSQQVFQ